MPIDYLFILMLTLCTIQLDLSAPLKFWLPGAVMKDITCTCLSLLDPTMGIVVVPLEKVDKWQKPNLRRLTSANLLADKLCSTLQKCIYLS